MQRTIKHKSDLFAKIEREKKKSFPESCANLYYNKLTAVSLVRCLQKFLEPNLKYCTNDRSNSTEMLNNASSIFITKSSKYKIDWDDV